MANILGNHRSAPKESHIVTAGVWHKLQKQIFEICQSSWEIIPLKLYQNIDYSPVFINCHCLIIVKIPFQGKKSKLQAKYIGVWKEEL